MASWGCRPRRVYDRRLIGDQVNTDERLVLEGNTQLDPDNVEDAAMIVAGWVAHADKPTPEEVDVCRELLEALGLRPARGA